MFTGIIEEIGVIESIKTTHAACTLAITAAKVLEHTNPGDSIAVNGICVTATTYSASAFKADIMNETLSRTTLARLRPGSRVNLERAMAANGRFGGHIVTGHIDGTGTISQIRQDGHSVWFQIAAEDRLLRYIIEKGSIAIDGISLTIAGFHPDSFSVSVIPHTFQNTILSEKRIGDTVNLENDCVGKYIESLLPGAYAGRAAATASTSPVSRLTPELLNRYGF